MKYLDEKTALFVKPNIILIKMKQKSPQISEFCSLKSFLSRFVVLVVVLVLVLVFQLGLKPRQKPGQFVQL